MTLILGISRGDRRHRHLSRHHLDRLRKVVLPSTKNLQAAAQTSDTEVRSINGTFSTFLLKSFGESQESKNLPLE